MTALFTAHTEGAVTEPNNTGFIDSQEEKSGPWPFIDPFGFLEWFSDGLVRDPLRHRIKSLLKSLPYPIESSENQP